MYKLVAVGGKIRGREFNLNEGENTLGKDASNSIQLELDGISKKHVRITVNGEKVFIEDLGSSNGTFLNEKLVKSITGKHGDRLALPNVIFQLVYIKQVEVIVHKKVLKSDAHESDDYMTYEPDVPDHLPGKVVHIFRYKIMPLVYGFNKEYEWRSIVAILLTIYIVITIGLTIFPVLVDNKQLLLLEVGKRGYHYADDISRMNARYLRNRDLDSIDTSFLEREDGVESYELFDMEGRIVRPLSKLNDFTNDTFSITAQQEVVKKKKNSGHLELQNGIYGIYMAIKAQNVQLGIEEPVGIIAIKFAPPSLALEASNNSKAYLESLFISFVLGILFYFIIYFLTITNIEDLRKQIDLVLRGRLKEVELKFHFTEMNDLKTTVNVVLQKLKESEGDSGEVSTEIEADDKYVNQAKEILQGISDPAFILNSEKLIKLINVPAEDLTGIRQSVGENMGLLDVSKDQGLAATIIDLCDQSANSEGMCQKGSYELQGREYSIAVNSLIGRDGFAKAYLITFINDQ